MEIKIGDMVQVIGGKYQGRSGIMVIMTAKMAVLRLTNGTVEVRVMRAKIRRKLSDQDPSHVVLTDEGPKDAEEAIRQGVMQELQAMRRRMDELISVLAALNVNRKD
jgi:ribosomal protein L24